MRRRLVEGGGVEAGEADSADKLPRVRFGCILLSLDSDLRDFLSILDCDDFNATGFGVARLESESPLEDPSPSSDNVRFNLLCKSGGKMKFVSSFGNGNGSKSSRALRLYIVLRCFQICSLFIFLFNFLLNRSQINTMKKC